jgi:hypothetical protein
MDVVPSAIPITTAPAAAGIAAAQLSANTSETIIDEIRLGI